MRAELLRVGLPLVVFAAGLALGNWLRLPSPAAARKPTPVAAVDADAARFSGAPAPELAASIARRDPFGLQRTQALNPAAAGLPAAPATESIEWRLAALSTSPAERWMLLTAREQSPMRVVVGDKLPNGEKVLRIEPTHVVLQDRRGKRRTLYLTEP